MTTPTTNGAVLTAHEAIIKTASVDHSDAAGRQEASDDGDVSAIVR